MEYSYTGAYGEFLAREIGVEWLGGIRRHLFPPGSMEASRNLVRTILPPTQSTGYLPDLRRRRIFQRHFNAPGYLATCGKS